MTTAGPSFAPGFGTTESRGPQTASAMARSQQLDLLTSNDLSCLPLAPPLNLGPCHFLSLRLGYLPQHPFAGSPFPPFQLFTLYPATPTRSCFVHQIVMGPLLCARCWVYQTRSCFRGGEPVLGAGLTRVIGMASWGEQHVGCRGCPEQEHLSRQPSRRITLIQRGALPAQACGQIISVELGPQLQLP